MGLVGITGLGGFGKSTLAAKLFDGAAALGFAKKFWVDLGLELSFPQMARRVLFALGMPAEQINGIEEPEIYLALVRRLQEQPCLLVLDNLESLLDEGGDWRSPLYQPFLLAWLGSAAQSKLLITSRERPAGLEGRWFALVDGLSNAEGAALVRQRGIGGSEADLAAVSERVGGYPLSLMLLSGWLAEEETDPQIEYLPEDLWGVAGRHRGAGQVSVEQVFDWSLGRLSVELRQLLCQTSVFRGGLNGAAAAMVLEVEPSTAMERDLVQLGRRSLLRQLAGRDRFGQKSFQFQPQVQRLVQRRAGDLGLAHRRAVDYYRQRLQRLVQQEQRQAEEAILFEYLEIFHHLCELGEYEAACRFVTEATEHSDRCDWFLQLRGYQTTRLEIYTRLVGEWQPAPQARNYYANCLKAKADVLQFLKQRAEAIALYDEAIQVYNQVGARLGYANCLQAKADVLQFLDQRAEAIALYDEAIGVYNQVGDRLGYANCLLGVGQLLDDPTAALERYWQAQAIYVEIGDRYSVGRNFRWFIAEAQIALGQTESAIESLTELAEIGEAIDIERWKTYALEKIAELRDSDSVE